MHIKVPSDESENLTIKMDDGSVDMKEIVVTSNPFAGNPKDISQSTLSISNLDMQIKKGGKHWRNFEFSAGYFCPFKWNCYLPASYKRFQ